MNTCFIIGNGPSFNRVPAGLLASFPTFGMNYAGFQPMYYVCVDKDILTDHAEEIKPLAMGARIAFFSGLVELGTLDDIPNIQRVNKDAQSFKAEQYMSGMTAAYVCLKMAYYMGFDDVHLYGIDHSPTWEHYRDDYRIGKKTNAYHMQVMEFHYQLAANVYARAGRQIINHSDPSKLDKIFRRA